MSEKNISLDEVQKKHDGIVDEIKVLENKKKDYLDEVGRNGIFLNSKTKKFEISEKVIGLFWDIDYNDRYIGERGMITQLFSGAIELSEQELSDFKLIFDYIINEKTFGELTLESELFKNALIIMEEEAEDEESDGDYVYEKTYNKLLSFVMLDFISCDEYFLYNAFLEKTDFKKEDLKLLWKQKEEGYNDGTLNKGSYIEIKETTTETIKKTKTVSGKVVNP